MKWVAISGAWRTVNTQVVADVEHVVTEQIAQGNGIVSGGALGVDYIATARAMALNPNADLIKIILPTTLAIFAAHFRKRAEEGVITPSQAEALIVQLTTLQQTSPNALVELAHLVCDQDTYYDRNTKVIEAADILAAFHVNGTGGTADAVDKARALGMEVIYHAYTIADGEGFNIPE